MDVLRYIQVFVRKLVVYAIFGSQISGVCKFLFLKIEEDANFFFRKKAV